MLERDFVDGPGKVPFIAGRLNGFRSQKASDSVSRDAQTPGYLSQRDLVANVPASNNAE